MKLFVKDVSEKSGTRSVELFVDRAAAKGLAEALLNLGGDDCETGLATLPVQFQSPEGEMVLDGKEGGLRLVMLDRVMEGEAVKSDLPPDMIITHAVCSSQD